LGKPNIILYQRYIKGSLFVISFNVMCVGIITKFPDYLLNTVGINSYDSQHVKTEFTVKQIKFDLQ